MLNDEFDKTKPKNFLEAVGKDLLQKTQLGRLAKAVGTLSDKIGLTRLGKLEKGGKQPLPNFDVLYQEENDFRTRLVIPVNYMFSADFQWPAGSPYPFKNGITFPFKDSLSGTYLDLSIEPNQEIRSNFIYKLYDIIL